MSIVDPYRRTGKLKGACMCGACTMSIDGDYIAAIGICHCKKCRVSTGFLSGLFEASKDAFSYSGPVKTYASTDFAERAFCGTCGTSLWMRNTDPAGDFELLPAAFPDADAFPVISEIYCDKAPAYGAFAGDHKRATQAQYEAKNRHVPD